MGKICQPRVIFFRILPLTRHGLWTLDFGLWAQPESISFLWSSVFSVKCRELAENLVKRSVPGLVF